MCDSDRETHNRIIHSHTQQIKSSNLFVTHSDINSPMSATSSSVSPSSLNLNFPTANNCLIPSLPVSSISNNMNHGQLSDYHRFQLYDYATQASMRFRLGHSPFSGNYSMAVAAAAAAGLSHPVFNEGSSFSSLSPFARFDPRFRFIHEEPKPQHSYIGLIAMAILSSPEQKMVLSDIYQHILDNYPYFRNRGPGWRNSIRHNLSLNDCFIKSGRSANGKGHYWAIHPANLDDFKKGDFRRRKAQRKVRKHMGLSVPDDDDSPSPTPPPPVTGPQNNIPHQNTLGNNMFVANALIGQANVHVQSHPICSTRNVNLIQSLPNKMRNLRNFDSNELNNIGHFYNERTVSRHLTTYVKTNKRQFDMESLLAPDCDSTVDDHEANNRSNNEPKSPLNCEHLDLRQSEENQPSVSPSVSSLNEYVISKADSIASDSSSPSVSSSAEKMKQNCHAALTFLPTAATMNQQAVSASNWQAVQLKSLQSLQQMGNCLGTGLMNQTLVPSGTSKFGTHNHIQMPWAMNMSAAFTNAQAAATLLGYASVAAQSFDLQAQGDKH